MSNDDDDRSFGVFKPVGHVVVSLPSAAQAQAAADALARHGWQGDAVRRYTADEMVRQIDADLDRANPLAAIGQEINLIRAHRELAVRGYHWLVVRVDGNAAASRVAELVKEAGAERAQHYGRFVIEELIEPGDGLSQVAESPDRGLDAQTPSGEEGESAARDGGASPERR